MVVGRISARLGAVTESVTGLVQTVQAGGLGSAGHDELSGLLAQLRGLQARLDYVNLAVVREVDVRGSFVADGALTAAAWARMHTRMTPGRPRVRCAPPGPWGRGSWREPRRRWRRG
jgi:hypothetical protein